MLNMTGGIHWMNGNANWRSKMRFEEHNVEVSHAASCSPSWLALIMKISELIEKLEKAERAHGDVECLIEVISDDVVNLRAVDELSFEKREGYGESILFSC